MPLRLFGTPELTRDDATRCVFVPERRFRLLAYLAVRGDWVPRARLASLFWPERDTGAARANLRKLLLEVRQLGLPDLEDAEAGLRWCPPTDLAKFEQALAGHDLDRATDFVLGPPLEGLEQENTSSPFDAWLLYERPRILAPWRRSLLESMADADPTIAGRWCTALLKVDALDEEAIAAWLRLAPATGDMHLARDAYRAYRFRLADALGIEPSLQLQRLAATLQRPAPPPSLPAVPGLVGRTAALAKLKAQLAQPSCRLLSLIGPGGVGKSCLARELARQFARDSASAGQAVWWVPLQDVLTPTAMAGRIADVVMPGVALQSQALVSLAPHWSAGPGLLVLDAVEHLVDAAEPLRALLRALPALKIVVTTRERLDIDVEWLGPVDSLGAPPSDAPLEAATDHPALQLFAQHARRVQPAFDLARDVQAVRGICAATDGLPLALELAAGWTRLMSCEQIERDLRAGLTWMDDAAQTLKRSFEQSWSLLTPAERDAFRRLAVFSGSFTRETAWQVCQVSLPLLASLADKSMLGLQAPGRFALHAVLRGHALQQLALEPALHRDLHDALGRWALAHLLHHHGVVDGRHAEKRAAIACERDNLLHAWRHWVETAAAKSLDGAAEVLSWFHVTEGRLPDAIELFAGAAHALTEATPEGAAMRAHQAWLALWMERYAPAADMSRRVLPVLKASRHTAGTLLALRTLAHAARRQGHHGESARRIDEAMRLARRAGDTRQLATLIDARAMASTMLGDYARAVRELHQAIELNERVGNEAQRMYNDFNLAQAHTFAGDLSAALPWADAAVRRAGDIGYRHFEPYVYCQRAAVQQALGRHGLADADLAHAQRVAETTSGRPAQVWVMELQARSALARGDVAVAGTLLQRAAALAQETGNVMMGAALVPVAARVCLQEGDTRRARRWLQGLQASPRVQAPVRAEGLALADAAGPAAGPAPDLATILLEIGGAR
jgi:predicted ATPase/DNA-binding SARP family transcriptional activator